MILPELAFIVMVAVLVSVVIRAFGRRDAPTIQENRPAPAFPEAKESKTPLDRLWSRFFWFTYMFWRDAFNAEAKNVYDAIWRQKRGPHS